jgi:hypothetical protein
LKAISEYLDEARVGTIISAVGALVGLIGVVAAYWFYRASQIGSRLVYQTRSFRLIGVPNSLLPSDVEVRFRGKTVQRVTKVQFLMWNSGKMTIHGRDIVSSDPIRLEFAKDAIILDAKIIRVTRPANQFSIAVDRDNLNNATISFDYIDPHDGVNLELLHTSSTELPNVYGTVRGVRDDLVNLGSIERLWIPGIPSWIDTALRLTIICIVTAFGFYFLFDYPHHSASENEIPKSVITLFNRIFGGVIVCIGLLGLGSNWIARRRFPKPLRGKELD